MYELTCPDCGHKVRSPFIRAGAMVDCPSCSHRFRIAATHFKRDVQWSIPATPEAGELVTASAKTGTREERQAAQVTQQVIGLSGLSEMMRQEPNGRDKGVRRPDPPAPAVESPAIPESYREPSAKGHRTTAAISARIKRKKRKKQNRMTIMLSVAALAMLGLVVASYLRLDGSRSQMYPSVSPDDIAQARLSQLRSPWPELKRLQIRRLYPEAWEIINQPFSPVGESQRPYIEVQRDGFITPGHRVMAASIRAWRDDRVLMHGRWQVSLVNQQNTELARTYLPVVALVPGQSQFVSMLLPQALQERQDLAVRFGPVIEVVTEPSAYFMQRRQHDEHREDDLVMLKLAVYNIEPVAMQHAVVLITGLDERQQPVARWMAEWSGRHEPDMWRESWVAMYVPSDLGVVEWSIDVIGFDDPVRVPNIRMQTGDAGPSLPHALFFNLDQQGRPSANPESHP